MIYVYDECIYKQCWMHSYFISKNLKNPYHQQKAKGQVPTSTVFWHKTIKKGNKSSLSFNSYKEGNM